MKTKTWILWDATKGVRRKEASAMAHTYNPALTDSSFTGAGASLKVWGQSELHSELQARPGFRVRPSVASSK